MKKLYTLALATLCATGAMATTPMVAESMTYGGRNLTPKAANLEYVATSTQSTKTQRVAAKSTTDLSELVGKSFVTVFEGFESQENYFFTVATDDNGQPVLQGLVSGYDVSATWDAATSSFTIPTGVVIGEFSTYGDLTLYRLVSDTQINTADVVVTIDGDKATFDGGLYASVSAGSLIFMKNIEGTLANASLSTSLSDGTVIAAPLLVNKTADDELTVVGISTLFYGSYQQVKFSLDPAAKTADLPFLTTVDYYKTYGDFYLGGINSSNNIIDLSLAITTDDNTSRLYNSYTFYGFANGSSYRGYYLSDFTIDVDYDVITAAPEGGQGSDEDTDTPVLSGVQYLLDRANATATVTGCDASVSALTIPSEITVANNVYTVNAVAENAFMANKNITSLRLPSTIETVGTDAFRNLASLRTLYIEDLAAWCGIEFANGNANPIYNVFPTSTSDWGNVYVDGVAVDALEIPEGVTYMGRAFYGFKSLKSVTLPSTLTEMGDQTFANCTALTEVEIPAGVESMGSVFFSCSGLKNVVFNSGVKSLKNTFYGCKALESVNLMEGVEVIGNMAFSSCSSLTELVIPSTVTEIGMMAFDGCTGVTKVTSYAEVPPTASLYAFDGIDLDVPVYVPMGTVADYQAAAEWSDFTNYQELIPVAVDTVGEDNAEAPVEYFNLQGVRVANPENGVYIRRQGNAVAKVLVK